MFTSLWKRALAAGVVVACAAAAQAQPANDECVNATIITPGSSTAGDNFGASGFDVTACAFNDVLDVWYRLTATIAGVYAFDTFGSAPFDTTLAAFDVCDGTQLACNDDSGGLQSRITVSLAAAQTVVIRVAGYNNTTGSFVLNVAAPQPPTMNDLCQDAIVLPPGQSIIGTNVGATGENLSSCAGTGDINDVWFSYTASVSGIHAFDTLGTVGLDTTLALFDACGGSELACDDDGAGFPLSRIQYPLSQGSTYYVRVAGYAGATGTFTLNSRVPSAPAANDTCATAQPIASLPFAYVEDISGSGEDLDVTCNDPNAVSTVNGVWFTYTPASTQLVRFSETSTANVVMAIFTGACEFPSEQYCSDPEDFIRELTGGTTYRILLGAYAVGGVPLGAQVSFSMTEVQAPPNDTCLTALVVDTVPFSHTVDISTATNDVDVSCNLAANVETRYGVWYRFIPPADGLYVFNETSSNDVVFGLFTGDCQFPSEFSCLQAEPTAPTFFSAGNPFYILVGLNSATTIPTVPITFTVSEVFAPTNDTCGTARQITATPFSEVVAGSTATNDVDVGCNSTSAAETGYGVWYTYQTGVDGGTFVLSETSTNDVVMAIFTGPDCASASEVFCTDAETNIRFEAQPNTRYWILVGMWSGVTVPGAAYGFSFNVELPLGACCTGGGCTLTTVSQCAGQHQGIGSSCGGSAGFNFRSSTQTFEDISFSGTQLGVVSACDDCGQIAQIGFDFTYLGSNYTDVWVSSNGFIQLPGSGGPNQNTFTNTTIPNSAIPNGIIAPLWDDFNTLIGNGAVYLRTDGVAPNRRTIISWQEVSQYLNSDNNNFQVILHETSNRIEFRYGLITPETPAGDYTVGYESLDGFTGGSYAAANLGGGNTALDLDNSNPCQTAGGSGACCSNADCIIATSGNCTGPGLRFVGVSTACNAPGDVATPCCRADTNQDGVVGIQDLFDFLALWFAQAPGANADGNPGIGLQDLFDYLRGWFTRCE